MFGMSAVRIAVLAILFGLTGCFRTVRSQSTGKEYSAIGTDARDRGPFVEGLKTDEKLVAEKPWTLQHWPNGHFIQDPK